MPLFYQHKSTKIQGWVSGKLENPKLFPQKGTFKKRCFTSAQTTAAFSGKILTSCMFPDFPLEEIGIADTRSHFLKMKKYHFSISHCVILLQQS